MGDLANCPRCDALFVQGTRDICHNCFKEEEQAFRTVYEFMKKRRNREATIPEIVEETGVEEDIIIKFVKEKRLRSSQFPKLTYPCEKCGKGIVEGRLCESCSNELITDLKTQEQINQISQKNREKEKRESNTYFNIQNKQNK